MSEWRWALMLSASVQRSIASHSIATWCEELWNYRFRIRFNSESIQGVVAQAVFRIFVVNSNGNRNFPYLNNDGKRWNGNWNWIDNDFNRNGRVASNWR